jgi:hypothetical protein
MGFVLDDMIMCRTLFPIRNLLSGGGLKLFKIVFTSKFLNGVNDFIGGANVFVLVEVAGVVI